MPSRNHPCLCLAASLAVALGTAFAAAPQKRPVVRHTVSGTVHGLRPGHHVVLRANKVYSKEVHTTSTGVGGAYILRGLTPGAYSVRPSHPRYHFHPNFASVVVRDSDRVDIDFAATFNPPPKGR